MGIPAGKLATWKAKKETGAHHEGSSLGN